MRSDPLDFKPYVEAIKDSIHSLDIQAYVERRARLLFALVLLVFTLQTCALALLLDIGIIPDETTHIGMIEYYLTQPIPMTPQPAETGVLGQVSHQPFLYHYVLSKIVAPFYEMAPAQIGFFALRFLNSALAVLSLISVWGLVNRLTKSKLIALTVVIAYSQTTMVFYIGSGVNYDNGVVLLSFIACALTAELINEWKINKFLLLNIVLQAGSLTKLAVLPLYVVCLLILIVIYRRTVVEKAKDILQANRAILVLWGASTLLMVFFHGRNIVQYQTLNPQCDQVLNHEACLDNVVYNRNYQLVKADSSQHLLDPVSYFPRWIRMMGYTLYRFTGHRSLGQNIPPDIAMVILSYLLVACAASLVFGSTQHRVMAVIALFYVFFLCYFIIYPVYRTYGVPGLATQGRYLMPVLPLLYFFGGNVIYFVVRRSGWLYLIAVILPLALIFYYGYGNVFRYADSTWANDWALKFIGSIQRLL